MGVELEGPFGIDDNDFAVLTMGLSLCNDLDAMVRTCNRRRIEARITKYTVQEKASMRHGARVLKQAWR